jgi:hypothetical protein
MSAASVSLQVTTANRTAPAVGAATTSTQPHLASRPAGAYPLANPRDRSVTPYPTAVMIHLPRLVGLRMREVLFALRVATGRVGEGGLDNMARRGSLVQPRPFQD